jgi:hypothetical protein
MLSRKHDIPEDLRGIDAALRDARPELPADRLASVAARARSRARASVLAHIHHKESFLRSRIAITLMLVLGFGFSSAGVGMAVNGVSSQDTSAADAQYDNVDQQPLVPAPNRNEVQDETDQGTNPTNNRGGNQVGGENANNQVGGENANQVAAEEAQETRQLGAEQGGEEELPFTGFAAIPVLLMGFALLTAGFVLRRRA